MIIIKNNILVFAPLDELTKNQIVEQVYPWKE